MKKAFTILLLISFVAVRSQTQDSTKTLKELTIHGYRTMNGIGRMKDEVGQIIFAGKKK
jgi:Fe(3+) dicitrate transport protein